MFQVTFRTESAAFWGGASGGVAACLYLQVLQEFAKLFNTPCTPAVSGGSWGFAPAARPARVWQELAGWAPAAGYNWKWKLKHGSWALLLPLKN